MKIYLLLIAMILLSTTCSANASLGENTNSNANPNSDSFILKKNETKEIGIFKVKMLSVGHTLGEKGHSVYANLEILHHNEIWKRTLYLSKEIKIGDKYLKLLAVNEKADPKLRDPFASTSCTLIVNDEPTEKAAPKVETTPSTVPTEYCFKNSGLKNEIMIIFTIEGKKVGDGEFSVGGYDNSTSGEIYHFNGTKAGNSLTVKFTGTVPEALGKIKKFVWTLGKTNLKVQMYGKNSNTNKWGVYTTTFEKCPD